MRVLWWFLLSLACAAASQANERIALVIGNKQYNHAPPLKNPGHDAKDIAEILSKLNFDVTLKMDMSRIAFEDAVFEFGRDAVGKKIALLFYAGHGIQFKGKNYLIPIDAHLKDEYELRRLIPLDDILQSVSQASDLGVAILDACRDNPFTNQLSQAIGTRSALIGRGLGRVEQSPANVLIAFATEAGKVAADGSERNSPYTKALKRNIQHPVDVRIMFGQVHDDVLKATNNRQKPFTYGSLGGKRIYLSNPPLDPPYKPPVEEKLDIDKKIRECKAIRNGDTSEPNPKEAVQCFKIVAEAGSMVAQFTLGRMYERGIGVEKNIGVAKNYYEQAAKQDHRGARRALKRLE